MKTATAYMATFGRVIYTAQRYTSAVYAVVVCPSVGLSVRPSVCLSQAGTVPKRINAGHENNAIR